MRLSVVARILLYRARLRRHEAWSRQALEAHQIAALSDLRSFAVEHSPFYRQFHSGRESKALGDLPVLTKALLMDHFDDIVTDRSIRLADIETYLQALRGDALFHGRYWVSATSGSSGRRSIIPSDAVEWATIVASYARANEWAGIRISPLHHARMAIVSSRTPFHQSMRVGSTVETPMVRTLRVDASQPLHEIVQGLDSFQPEVLVAYASMIRVLAEEQLADRLHISPRYVNCASEVLTPEARERAEQAWHVPLFNVYAATETGGIAAECDRHSGLHLFEDLVIPEVVDDEGRPVLPGATGSRLLVTVLFSRTLPLIRYELTDRVQLAQHLCSCGRPFRLLAAIEGRTDDVIEVPGSSGGTVRLHPIVFHHVLDLLHAGGWQVRQESHGIHVLVTAPHDPLDRAGLEATIAQSIRAAGGAQLSVRVEEVSEIPAGAAGKRPLVVAQRRQRAIS